MKKFLTAVLLATLIGVLVFTLVSCKQKTETPAGYSQFFKNFSSTAPYKSATETLRLSEGTTVDYYDRENDVFVTSYSTTYEGTTFKVYGLCSSTEEYIVPRTANYLSGIAAIVDICGDYAIIAKYYVPSGGSAASTTVGVIKFRGANAGTVGGFSYNYAAAIKQYVFLNDTYLLVLGSKDSTSTVYSYATVYDYVTTDGLMEVGKIDSADNTTVFALYEGRYLSGISNNVIRFYDLTSIDSNGSFRLIRKYEPFSNESSFSETDIAIENFYLGGGWFIITGIYSTYTEYDGYEIAKTDDENKTYYLTVKSVRYNQNADQYYENPDRVTLVANKYNSTYINALCDALNDNNTDFLNADNDQTRQQLYMTPVVPISDVIRDGYSLVYYYYYFYTSEDGTTNKAVLNWDTSFAVYNEKGDPTYLTNLYMPQVYVDGYGLMNMDPSFSLPALPVSYYDYPTGTLHTILPITAQYSYDNALIHSGVIISYRKDLKTGAMMVGACSAETGKVIADYQFYNITPFFGDYAIGMQTVIAGDAYSIDFYRLDKSGKAVQLSKVYGAYNGVYVTREGGKYALYANDGTSLIPAKCDYISTVDTFFTADGKYISSVAVTIENGTGVIYKLS